MADRQPWDRLVDDGESTKAYAAFCLYRDMGIDRSMRQVCEDIGRPPGYKRMLETWSSEYRWGERSALYDDHVEAAARKELSRRHIEMRMSHYEIGGDLLEICRFKLKAVLEHAEQYKGKLPSEVSMGVMPQLLGTGSKLQRLAVGEPTEIVRDERPEERLVFPMPLSRKAYEVVRDEMEKAGKLPGSRDATEGIDDDP